MNNDFHIRCDDKWNDLNSRCKEWIIDDIIAFDDWWYLSDEKIDNDGKWDDNEFIISIMLYILRDHITMNWRWWIQIMIRSYLNHLKGFYWWLIDWIFEMI